MDHKGLCPVYLTIDTTLRIKHQKISVTKILGLEPASPTRNDKAFSLSGRNTNLYMACPELISPRITKGEIKNIILGGGQDFLSPERRFDAIILSNPEIFNQSISTD